MISRILIFRLILESAELFRPDISMPGKEGINMLFRWMAMCQAHDAAYLDHMLELMKKNNDDMVIGSRFIEKEGFQSSGLRRIGINFFAHWIKLITGKVITDATSGMRLINRRTIEYFALEYPRDYPEPESVTSILKKV